MWRGMAACGLDHLEPVQWMDQEVMLESSGEPFMSPSGHVTCEDLGGGETEERIIHSVCLSQGACRCRVVNTTLELVAGCTMSS